MTQQKLTHCPRCNTELIKAVFGDSKGKAIEFDNFNRYCPKCKKVLIMPMELPKELEGLD